MYEYAKAKINSEDTYLLESIYSAISSISKIIDTKEEVFDSATVAKEVIKNAFTIVSQVITTRRLIAENVR